MAPRGIASSVDPVSLSFALGGTSERQHELEMED